MVMVLLWLWCCYGNRCKGLRLYLYIYVYVICSNILNNARMTAFRCGYTSVDRACVPVPMYHCFGMVLGSLAILSRYKNPSHNTL